jgi:phosphoheptose isomerase
VLRGCEAAIAAAEELLLEAFRHGRQLLVCGNGGNAADADHIAAELVKACAVERPLDAEVQKALLGAGDDGALFGGLQRGLPAHSLASQGAVLTAVANDQSAELVFAQQVVAYGRPGDVLWALTTSGRSRNIVQALRAARALGLRTLALTGAGADELDELCDVRIALPATSAQVVQELQLPVYHYLCLSIESELFG